MKQQQQQLQRAISRDSPQKRRKIADSYNYGQLNFKPTTINTKKIILKTFFGNPQTEVFSIRFDQDDQLIAAGCSDGLIKIFSMATGKLLYSFMGSSGGETPTTIVRWRPEVVGSQKLKSILVSGNSDGTIIHWQANTGQQLNRIVEADNQILCMDFNLDGTLFATGGKDFCVYLVIQDKIRVYDDDRKEVIHKYEAAELNTLGHANRVFSIKFLKDQPNIFLSGGWDGNVLIWDLRDRKASGSINGPNLTGDSLDYKNGEILTGSYRNTEQVQLWDLKQRKLIKDIQWVPDQKLDNFYVYAAQFSKTGSDTIMVGSSGLQELKVFDCQKDHLPTCHIGDLQSGIELEYPLGIYSLDYGNVTNKFVFGGGEGVVYICSLVDQK